MINKLQHIDEFRDVLSGYAISKHAHTILQQIQLIMMVAPSSSGRNTVIRELVKTNKFHFIISDTTRHPRVNDGVLEQNGREYWFKTEEEMLTALQAGEMLEAELIHGQQVSGISIAEIERAQAEGKIAITDMDIGGVENVIAQKPDALAVFLLPPSFDEWQRRMNDRGHMHDDERQRRLQTAIKILRTGLQLDASIFVINDEFHQTTKVLENIYNTQPDQTRAREIAQELVDNIEESLS